MEFKELDDFMNELSNMLLKGQEYDNDSQRKKAYYDSLKEMKHDWGRKKTCMYPGCKKVTINKSHTIQENGPLSTIAENHDVLTPEFYKGKLNLKIEKIANASTFPGFCDEHENIFEVFEKNKKLENDIDYSLQVFRTICRHVYMLNNRHNHLVNQKEEVSTKKLQAAKKLLGNYTESFPNEILTDSLISVKDNKDKEIECAIEEIKQFIENAKELYDTSVVDIINNKIEEFEICTCLISDITFPVCLSGVGNLQGNGEMDSKNISVIMNVLPQNNDTLIIAAVHKKYAKELYTYMQEFITTDLGIINLIESWMAYGTDHWFITPSIWNQIPNERKNKFLDELHSSEYDITHIYPYSIFDAIRKEAIQRNERLIENEKNKITE